MKNVHIAFRSLFKKGRHNGIKIISLGVGLAMGLVLIAKVCFELSYDNFYPESDRVFAIQENVSVGEKKIEGYPHVSAGVPSGMKAEIPGVESATCANVIGEYLFTTSDKKKYTGNFVMADQYFFDVLPRKVLAGNAKETLSRPLYALVSEKIAAKIGSGKDVVGQTFEIASFPGHLFTIGGVFEEVPDNTHLKYNDYALMLCPLEELYAKSPATKRMAVMLVAIAFAILFAALMNYVLLVISSLVTRSKDIAVHKCYGASGWNISDMIFSETFLNLLVSLGISALLILALREMVEELLSASLLSLFTVDTVLMLVAVCVIVFLVAGLLPSQLFSKIPVASVFRSYKESRRSWKKVLLFIQFVAVGFLVCLLVVIGLQYNRMVNDNPGYKYERLAYCRMDGVPGSSRRALMDELKKLPEVEDVSTCSSLPAFSGSGDMVYRPGTKETIIHFADLYGANANYTSLMEMSVILGKGFDHSYSDSSRVVMISRMMADKLALALDWKDGVIGKKIYVSGHGTPNDFEIAGVYDDVRVGAIGSELMGPSALFYSGRPQNTLVIKLNKMSQENMARLDEIIKATLPDKEMPVSSYSVSMANMYNSSRLFRNAVMLGGIVTLIITLIGLIGYINDETNRRGKEIAVRKINGATEKDILSLIASDVTWMAFPALLLGAGASYYAGEKWLQQFAEKISMNVGVFTLSVAGVLLLILGTVVYRSWMVAVSNPVESLKSE